MSPKSFEPIETKRPNIFGPKKPTIFWTKVATVCRVAANGRLFKGKNASVYNAPMFCQTEKGREKPI